MEGGASSSSSPVGSACSCGLVSWDLWTWLQYLVLLAGVHYNRRLDGLELTLLPWRSPPS